MPNQDKCSTKPSIVTDKILPQEVLILLQESVIESSPYIFARYIPMKDEIESKCNTTVTEGLKCRNDISKCDAIKSGENNVNI
jgi:hypothetical protein